MTAPVPRPELHVIGAAHDAAESVAQRRERNAAASQMAWLAALADWYQGAQLGVALGRNVSVLERIPGAEPEPLPSTAVAV